MHTNTLYDIGRVISSLEDIAKEHRKFCRKVIHSYHELINFSHNCLNFYELGKTNVDMEKETGINKDIIAFLIRTIYDYVDNLFIPDDELTKKDKLLNFCQTPKKLKSIDWEKFIISTKHECFLNITFDNNEEDVKNNWAWPDYITVDFPSEIELSTTTIKTMCNYGSLDLHENGTWRNYLRLQDSFGNKQSIVVSSIEEKTELFEMYRLMNKYL